MYKRVNPKSEKTKYYYDDYGNLIKTVMHGGETEVIVYDELGRNTQVVTPNLYDDTVTTDIGYRYTHYSNGLLHTSIDPEDNITTYTYDVYGNIKTKELANGCIYIYKYDALQRIIGEYVKESSKATTTVLKTYQYSILADFKTQVTEVVHLNQNDTAITVRTYDYAGRLVRQVNPDGGIIYTNYNVNGTIKSSVDPLGFTSYYKYDGLNQVTEEWLPFENGNRYTYKTYAYDKNGNRTKEQIGLESVYLWSKSSTYIGKTYEYNENNKMTSIRDTAGGLTCYEYDANDNPSKEIRFINDTDSKVTSFEYNHLGKVATMSQYMNAGDIYGYSWDDKTELVLNTSYTYDANGNTLSMVAADGRITTYGYDKLDRQIASTVEAIDEYGKPTHITTSVVYDFAGNVIEMTDGRGNTTRNQYNQRSLLEYTIDPLGGVTAYSYDNAGRLVAKVTPENYVQGDPLTNMSRAVYSYDKMNRILLEQDIYFNRESNSFKNINAKSYQYDKNGNTLKTIDALGYETTYTYNNRNDLLTSLSPASKSAGLRFDVLYTYDAAGRKVSETNADYVVTKYYYDGLDKVLKTTIVDSTEKVLQEVTYDGLGNVITQTDGNGNISRYNYNRLGLVRSKMSPNDESIDQYTEQYQYNTVGQLVYQKDNMDRVIITTYNHAGQVLTATEQMADGSQSIMTANAYDSNGNIRFSTDGNNTTREYIYDALNRVHKEKIIVGKVQHVTTSTYDKNGNPLTSTDWLGNTHVNEYDALNRLTRKLDPYGKVVERYVYNDNHAQIKSYDALDNVTTFTYDRNHRLLSTTDPEGNVTSQTYDKVGNIATKKDGNGNTTIFGYDALNRLIRVTNAKGEITNYTYDMNGNMLTQSDGKGNTVTYTYNAMNRPNKKEDPSANSSRTEIYSYYANGLLATKTNRNGNTITYLYDVHGNLLNETIADQSITYTYDNNSNLITMTDSTGTTTRTYDELGRVLTKCVPNVGIINYQYDIVDDVKMVM